MQVIVNGEAYETRAVFVADLVRERGADPARVAVVLNDAVLPAAARAATRLADGDRIELLTFAGGGCGKHEAMRLEGAVISDQLSVTSGAVYH